MKEYFDETYGEKIADVYDTLYADFDPAMIDLLAGLAEGGPALELGIGTGRVALPLLERGVAVEGIDASPAMTAKLHARPRGAEIPVHTGSFAEFSLERRFKLIYVVFNTFYGLLTQEEQVHCFQSAAQHLAPGGLFLLEVFVPDRGRFINHQTMRVVSLEQGEVRFDLSQHDPVAQQVTSQHVFLSPEGTRLYPVKLRYAWPAELDLMARLAGLSLHARWEGWEREPFTKDSTRHVSSYTLAG